MRSFSKTILSWVVSKIQRLCGSHERLASFYYFAFSKKFDREHFAVLKGKLEYEHRIENIAETSSLLRRNIHRLEKGLIMRPRRRVFAESFIGETVSCFQKACEKQDFSRFERKWAKDVLDNYFSVVDDTLVIKAARLAYSLVSVEGKMPPDDSNDVKFKPYDYISLPGTAIKFEDLKKLYLRRRSVRWFSDRAVPFDLIRKAINIAVYAPSACNRQPYHFFVSNSAEKTTEIAKCVGGTVGFAEKIPAIIAVIGDLSCYPHERDRHLIYIDASLAVMQLLLALEVQGLSSCTINWPDLVSAENKIRKIINLPAFNRVVMLVAVGCADETGGVPFSQKKKDDFVMTELK